MENLDISQFQLPSTLNVVDIITGSRNLRNKLLRDNVDTINPIRYEALTDEQRTELKAYRQALLDLPQQTGWPNTVDWPTKPTWL
jgi:Phage tail assembly chaperone protein